LLEEDNEDGRHRDSTTIDRVRWGGGKETRCSKAAIKFEPVDVFQGKGSDMR